MSIPKLYRRVNPTWLADFRLAHSNKIPVGYFSPSYISPNPYIIE